ncbi:MAG TPA: hypothetical protein DHW42_05060, partial [Candidatus Marinimicrobia bacterium]|nr:hypothetical protein [Candidatus Neomarinimicrobiota bacterium]
MIIYCFYISKDNYKQEKIRKSIMRKYPTIYRLLILLLLFINQVSTSGSDWINQLNKTIKENGQNWVAG